MSTNWRRRDSSSANSCVSASLGGPGSRANRTREGAQDARIDRVGLGQFTRGPSEVAHLAGIDHRKRHTARGQLCSRSSLQTTGGLHHHQRRGIPCHGVTQHLQRRIVVPALPRQQLRGRIGEHVQRALGHVDPYETLNRFTHTPILVKHANCTGVELWCAQATVRATDERLALRSELSHGIDKRLAPRACRAAAPNRSRLWICGRCACGAPAGLPWTTLRVAHRAHLRPQAPQPRAILLLKKYQFKIQEPVNKSDTPASASQTTPLVVANARRSLGYGCALRQGQEALAFARQKQSSGLFMSGRSLDRPPLDAPLGHVRKTLTL